MKETGKERKDKIGMEQDSRISWGEEREGEGEECIKESKGCRTNEEQTYAIGFCT